MLILYELEMGESMSLSFCRKYNLQCQATYLASEKVQGKLKILKNFEMGAKLFHALRCLGVQSVAMAPAKNAWETELSTLFGSVTL